MAGEEGGSRNQIARTEHVDLGDADAVEKSTYLGDRHGADVGGKADQPVHLTSSVRSERGLGPMGWIAALLALPGLVIYGARLFD